MKSCVCLLLFVAYVLAVTTKQRLTLSKLIDECSAETQTSQDSLSFKASEIFENAKFKKYLLCMCKRTGMMSASGDIYVDTIKGQLRKQSTNEDTISEVEKCLVKKETPEDTAVAICSCLDKYKPEFSPV